MLDFISVPHVFIMFLYHFGMIYGTNLLTRCPLPFPVFCCLFVSKKFFWEVSRIALIFYRNYFQYETKTEPEGRPEGSPRGSRRHLAAPGCHLDRWPTSSHRLFAYKFSLDAKTLDTRSYFSEDVRGRRHLKP